MTTEEAISFGNMWLELNEDAEESETYQFFKMAISVLSAQNEAMTEEELAEFKKELANAVPKREKGEWLKCDISKNWWKCSICGQVIYSESAEDRKEFWAFCSRCGADMRGE